MATRYAEEINNETVLKALEKSQNLAKLSIEQFMKAKDYTYLKHSDFDCRENMGYVEHAFVLTFYFLDLV